MAEPDRSPSRMENEQMIKRFLLGELAGAERIDLEEQFIIDQDLFDQIKIVEDELVESYVRGWMPPLERPKFEKSYLTSTSRRNRVEFSRQLFEKLALAETVPVPASIKTPAVNSEDTSVWDRLTALFLTPKVALAGAFALIVVVGGWFAFQNLSSVQLEVARDDRNTVTGPTLEPKPEGNLAIESPEDRDIATNALNTDEGPNTNRGAGTPEITRAPPSDSPKATDPVVRNPVLALFAGTVRSDRSNSILNLPREARSATLLLNLGEIDYSLFRAELTDADGNVLFQRVNLTPRKNTVSFTIPAKNLTNGDYLIKLSGRNELGEDESAADFQFRVQR